MVIFIVMLVFGVAIFLYFPGASIQTFARNKTKNASNRLPNKVGVDDLGLEKSK